MRFHLDHIPKKPDFEITHGQKIFLLGSCFSENIGARLKEYNFSILSNPNGILFNPISMHHCLDGLMTKKPLDEKHILSRDGVFLSYAHHSAIHSRDKNALLEKIHGDTLGASAYLKEADILILTFGSAFMYRHLQINEVVANCHKQPSSTFEKSMLQPAEIFEKYVDLIKRLKRDNSKIKIIFTVSPVKHLKDGLVENNLSKAVLLLSIHQLVQQHPDSFYFPAYELVNDDLRDYRFYKKDLAHPNEQAIEYIWEKFSVCFFDTATQNLNQQIHKLNQALGHRNLMKTDGEDPMLQEFISKQKELIDKLKKGSKV